MGTLRRITVVWSGYPGTPYYSTFNFTFNSGGGTTLANAVGTFLTALKADVIAGCTATIQPEQTIIDESTGNPTGTESIPPPAPIVGTNTGESCPYATQGLVRLQTNLYVGARRLNGRLYLPAMSQNNSHGVPITAFIGRVDTAANALLAASSGPGPWRVYSRKNGVSSIVTAVSTWNNWAVLRSRRD